MTVAPTAPVLVLKCLHYPPLHAPGFRFCLVFLFSEIREALKVYGVAMIRPLGSKWPPPVALASGASSAGAERYG